MLILVGVAAVATLPLPRFARVLAALAWCLAGAWELRCITVAWANCRALRVGLKGDIRVLGNDGEWGRARLLPGSLLLRRWGWIRVRCEGGTVFAELLRGTCRECRDWRRLQVIWRHVGDGQ